MLAPRRDPPRTHDELVAWLGIGTHTRDRSFSITPPIPGVTLISGWLANAGHHQRHAPLDVFAHVKIVLAARAHAFEAGLAAIHGPPLTVTRPRSRFGTMETPEARYRRYGDWLVNDAEIAWYDFLPEWAAPPVDDDARCAVLARWLGCVAAASTIDDVKAFADASPCAGIAWNTVNDRSVHLLLEPRLPITRVVALLGVGMKTLRWRGVGVHLAGWEITRDVGRFRFSAGFYGGMPNGGGEGRDAPLDPLDRVATMSVDAG